MYYFPDYRFPSNFLIDFRISYTFRIDSPCNKSRSERTYASFITILREYFAREMHVPAVCEDNISFAKATYKMITSE